MALPRKLKYFNQFLDGESWLGLCPEVDLPELARKLDEYRGGGMEGPVAVDMGQEKLEAGFTTGFDGRIFRKYAATKADAILLRFAGSWQRDDVGDVSAVEVVMRGRIAKIEALNAKAGDDSPVKVKMALTYYKLVMDGETLIEIDLLNFIHNVNGEDMLAAHRSALGI